MELSVGIEPVEEKKVTMNNGSPVVEKTNEMETKSGDEKREESNEPEETMNSFGVGIVYEFELQLAMNIMKGIAGTGCLALPVAVYNVEVFLAFQYQVGIIWAILLFVIVSAGYILGSYQLLITNDDLADRKIVPIVSPCHQS